jgi:hypothetical protein
VNFVLPFNLAMRVFLTILFYSKQLKSNLILKDILSEFSKNIAIISIKP